MRPLTLRRLLLQCSMLAVILFVVVVIALKFGAVPVSLYALGRDLLRVVFGQSSQISSDYGLIVVNIRLPRILLGVTMGASLGSILALILEPHLTISPLFAALLTPLGAFLGAAATITAVYFLGRREGQLDSATLLLGGVIISSFLSAIIMFLMNTLSGNLRGLWFWLMGDLSTPLQKSAYWFLGIGFLLATGAIYTTAADLNMLLAGEKEAMHLGVDVPRVRLVVYIAASVLTGLAVSVSGAIGYVGLIVPHAIRFIFGSDHRTLLPTAALGGAIALVFADTLARTVVAPTEVSVGAVTAVVGAPLFIYLLRRRLS